MFETNSKILCEIRYLFQLFVNYDTDTTFPLVRGNKCNNKGQFNEILIESLLPQVAASTPSELKVFSNNLGQKRRCTKLAL